MSVRPVLQLGDPLLRLAAVAVEDPQSQEIRDLVRDLADTLAHWRAKTGYGRGIAAPPTRHLAARHLSKAARSRALAADQS